jgi:4-hydroxymandelate oxidase
VVGNPSPIGPQRTWLAVRPRHVTTRMRTLPDMVDIAGLEEEAARHLDAMALDYLRGGSGQETTVAENTAAWGRLRLRPHVLRDVSQVRLDTTVLGTPVRSPVLVAPTAYHELANAVGESGTAAAAAACGTVMVLSTFSTQTLEVVASAVPDAGLWFQLYVHKDRGWTRELVLRAVAAGYRAVVLTADVPVLGLRRRDERNDFALPAPLVLAHSPELSPRHGDRLHGSALAAHVQAQVDPALTFDDIGWLSELSGLPVVVKGVLRGDDAEACVAAGAAAVIVSNHGGRQMDGALATARALPDVVDAVGTTGTEIYVDGGIRSGVDVLRALALGARAVMVGRPVMYGLAVDGEAGVRSVLATFSEELAQAMALCGAADVSQLDRDLIAPPEPTC